MRMPLLMTAAGIALFVATAYAQETPTVDPAQPQTGGAAVEVEADAAASGATETAAPKIRNRKDKVSYAVGVDLARDIKRQRSEFNLVLVMQALADELSGSKLIMTDEEISATLKMYALEQKQDLEHAKSMIGEKNKKAAEASFAENLKKEGVVTLPSGLQYKILTQGNGKMPALKDRVVIRYRGTLLDGREFDSSARRGDTVTLPVKGMIAGWTQALQMMPVGSKWQIFIPPQLAYGSKPINGIGPNATLVYEVELVSIKETQTALTK